MGPWEPGEIRTLDLFIEIEAGFGNIPKIGPKKAYCTTKKLVLGQKWPVGRHGMGGENTPPLSGHDQIS